MESIRDALPDAAPRFLIVSFEMKHKDGRTSLPLIGIYYNPDVSSTTQRMLYASSSTNVFQKAEVTGKVFDLDDCDSLTSEWLTQSVVTSLTRP